MNTPATAAAPAELPPRVDDRPASRPAPGRLLRGADRVPSTGNGVAAPHLLEREPVGVLLARHDRSRS